MSMITYAALADLAEAMSLPSAEHLRASAEDEARGEIEELRDDGAWGDAVHRTLSEIPEPAPSTKHNDDCWRRHARCLADRILDVDA